MNFTYKQINIVILVALFLSLFNVAKAVPVPETAPGKVIEQTTFTAKQPLTIAINPDLAPYYSIDKQGKAVGLMVDLWHLWAKKQQVKIEFVVLSSWSETLNQVALGNIDVHCGLAIIDSRRQTLAFSKPLFSKHSNLYVNQTLHSVNSLNDLKPYSIGVVSGSVEIESLKNSHPDFSLKTYDNRHDLYNAALNKEILVFTALGGNYVDGLANYMTLRQQFPMHKMLYLQQRKFGVAVAKNNTGLLAYINEGFGKISKKERATIEGKWLTLNKQKDSLLIVFPPNYAPYMAISPLGEAQGLLIDVWRLWSKHVGIDIEFIARDIYEAIDLVAEQEADILLALPNVMKIPDNMSFAKPIYASDSQIYLSNKIKDNNGKKLSSLSQLSQHPERNTIGLWHISSLKKLLEIQYPQLNFRYFKNASVMINATESGDISGFFGLNNVVEARLVGRNLQNSFHPLDKPIIRVEVAPVIHFKNKKLLKTINNGFSQLNINSLIKIEERWLNKNLNHAYYNKQRTKVYLNDAEENFIAFHKKFNLGILKSLSPIEFISSEGDFSGINQDIIKLISDRTGLEFNVIAFNNWNEIYNALLNKKIDVLGNIMTTKKREHEMLFTDSYWQTPWGIVHPKYDGRQTKLEYFYGKEVAIVKGRYLVSKLKKEHPLITLKLVDNREQGFTELERESVDGFITTITSATHLLEQKNSVNLMISIIEGVSIEKSHFGINIQSPLLKEIMNKGLSTITDTEKQAIYNNWFTFEIKTGFDKKVVLKLALKISAVILIVLVIILVWNRRLRAEIKHREQLEKRMKHMATHDELTGLANRLLLKDRLSTAIEFHRRQSLKMAVLFLDLDGFKNINDTYGHDIGDELLQQVALRLLSCVRSSDTVVRFGGDEFVLLLTGLHNANEAANIAEKVLIQIQKEFELSKMNTLIGGSIGIAMYPFDGDNDIDLLKIADTLMYKVKAAGKNHYMFAKTQYTSV